MKRTLEREFPNSKKLKVNPADREFLLEIERWIERVLTEVYPRARVQQNGRGKPRKGAFEVKLNLLFSPLHPTSQPNSFLPSSSDPSARLVYSKLEKFGPQKDRTILPDPSLLVYSLFPEDEIESSFQPPSSSSLFPIFVSENCLFLSSDSPNPVSSDNTSQFDESKLTQVYRSMSVSQLKNLLRTASLSTSGRKEELIQRLLSPQS